MRPGQETPDEEPLQRYWIDLLSPSMRPGQETPDEDGDPVDKQSVGTYLQ